jgi:hypothetical protein
MKLSTSAASAAIALLGLGGVQPAAATPSALIFSTGDTDGKIATATRPGVPGGPFEIESADDFI